MKHFPLISSTLYARCVGAEQHAHRLNSAPYSWGTDAG